MNIHLLHEQLNKKAKKRENNYEEKRELLIVTGLNIHGLRRMDKRNDKTN